MNCKEFLLDLKTDLESAIDRHITKRKAIAERRAPFIKLMKPGLSEVWRAQYEAQPHKYIEKPDGL